MDFDKTNYLPRLVDKKVDNYLKVFGAISIEGPKWCGKTWTSSMHSKSIIYLDDEETMAKALLGIDTLLNQEFPLLIDEWHLLPKVWDKIRRKCDQNANKGKYILTCSTKLSKEKKKQIFHSGAGRIGKLKMYTMSLYESGDSSGNASIMDMYNNKQKYMEETIPSLEELANLIVRGGWPSNINVEKELISLIPKSYIDSILDKDINDDKKRDKDKMLMILKSLARNETSLANNNVILKDIESIQSDKELSLARNTLTDYLDALNRLNLIENQSAYSGNYRSKERISKSPKRHFTDPSLACALLGLNSERLLKDIKTFGLLFESLVERDLRIYMDYLGGNLYHFRDNVTGLEVDSILEFENGEYAAVEIKLGYNQIEEAKKNLLKFSDKMNTKPKFMCVITGNFSMIGKDSESGIYVLPITALKP